jgi:hypothetical protein
MTRAFLPVRPRARDTHGHSAPSPDESGHYEPGPGNQTGYAVTAWSTVPVLTAKRLSPP